MKKTVWMAMILVIIGSLALAACGGGGGSGSSSDNAPMVKTPPPEYANAKNPMDGNADAVTKGKDLYAQNCASCHGNEIGRAHV